MTAPPRPDWPPPSNLVAWQVSAHRWHEYAEWLEQQLELCEAKLEAGREPMPWGDLD